jgi:drug/metabolite transporter (DMT)-like permease
VISVIFAVLTALANGAASVLQRQAAWSLPQSRAFHLSLFGYLIRHKVWLAGVAMVTVAAVCQAAALATGPLARVQPIFIIELPFSLLLASLWARRRLPPLSWGAVALVTVSLGAGLAAAAPSGGAARAPLHLWLPALAVTACLEAALITAGARARGNPRAAALGLAAGVGYGLTAALMKSALAGLAKGPLPFLTSWQLYGTAIAGVGALFLFQNSLQAGYLTAAQLPLTLGDALSSITYGVLLYGETIRTGGWLAAEIAATALAAAGCAELSRSLATLHPAPPPPPPGTLAGSRQHPGPPPIYGAAASGDRGQASQRAASPPPDPPPAQSTPRSEPTSCLLPSHPTASTASRRAPAYAPTAAASASPTTTCCTAARRLRIAHRSVYAL